jgi:WD40 repeat protein
MGANPKPYEVFGRLLSEGIKNLARGKSIEAVHQKLYNSLGYASTTIYSWRRGEHLPQPEVIAQFARMFVEGWQADQAWINNFLEKGKYSPPQKLHDLHEELFGSRLTPDLPTSPLISQPQAEAGTSSKIEKASLPEITTWQYTAGTKVASVSVTEDGETIIAGTLGKTVIALDKGGRRLWQQPVRNQAWRNAVSADGKTIVVGTGSTRPWDLSGRGLVCFNNDESLRWQADLGASVWGLALSDDGKTVAAGTSNKQLILFDGAGNRLWHQDVPGLGPYAWVWSTALAANGQIVAAGAADKRLRVLERSGHMLAEYTLRGDVFAVATSADGEIIAAGDGAGYAYLLTKQGILLWEEQLADKVWAVVLSKDGTRLLIGAGEKEAHLRIYDQAGRLMWRRHVGGSVSSLATSENGQWVVTGTRQGGIFIFGQDGTVLQQSQAKKSVRDVAISAIGELIVAGSEDGQIYGFQLFSPSSVSPQ